MTDRTSDRVVGRDIIRARPCEMRSRVVICPMVRYWFLSKADVGDEPLVLQERFQSSGTMLVMRITILI